jgi:ATP synthase protein I
MKPPDDPLKSAARGRFEAMRTFGQIGTVGLSFVLAIVIGVALGTWLDRLTGWSPWFLIGFFILGFIAGVLNVYRTISRFK